MISIRTSYHVLENHIDNQFYLVGVSVTIYLGKDATVYNARNDDTMEKIFLCQPFVGQFLPNVVDSEKFFSFPADKS